MIVERIVHEAKLAWAVADAAKPYLSAMERNAVFVAIGAGETFAAIRGLLRSVDIKRIPLGPHLLQQCRTWLRGYGGHEDERHLRRLVEEPLIPHVIGASATIRVTRVPAAPKPRSWLRFPAPGDAEKIGWSCGSGCIPGDFANRPQGGHDSRDSTDRISSSAADVSIAVRRGTG